MRFPSVIIFVNGGFKIFLFSDSESVEWASFDANHEMNDQTAEEVLNSLQNNFWHGKKGVMLLLITVFIRYL